MPVGLGQLNHMVGNIYEQHIKNGLSPQQAINETLRDAASLSGVDTSFYRTWLVNNYTDHYTGDYNSQIMRGVALGDTRSLALLLPTSRPVETVAPLAGPNGPASEVSATMTRLQKALTGMDSADEHFRTCNLQTLAPGQPPTIVTATLIRDKSNTPSTQGTLNQLKHKTEVNELDSNVFFDALSQEKFNLRIPASFAQYSRIKNLKSVLDASLTDIKVYQFSSSETRLKELQKYFAGAGGAYPLPGEIEASREISTYIVGHTKTGEVVGVVLEKKRGWLGPGFPVP